MATGAIPTKPLAKPQLDLKIPLRSPLKRVNSIDSKTRLRRVMSTPGLRALVLVLTSFVLYLRHGSTSFYRDPGSMFYDADRAFERDYSVVREAQGQEFLTMVHDVTTRNASRGLLPLTKAGSKPTLCASFITNLQSGEKSSIDSSIATLLDRLTTFEREDLHLKTFFASANASKHHTWNKPWLRSLVDEVYQYQGVVSDDEYKLLAALERESTEEVKSVSDYAIALRHCYDSTNAPYIAVFEDDIIVAETWFARTMKAIKDIKTQTEHEEWEEDKNKWLTLRLFNQERSTGWPSRRVGQNNEHWYVLCISSFVFGLLVVLRRKSHTLQRHYLDNWTIAVICLVAIPGFVVLFFQSGKASMLPPRAGVRQEDFGCGAQGMVFPREQVPGLIRYLKQREVGQYDMITRDYARHQKLGRYSLYPVQMQHMGLSSPPKTTPKTDAPLWSMAFESINPKKIEKQHMHLVSELYHNKIKAAASQQDLGP